MHPCTLNAGCCGIMSPGDTLVVADELDERSYVYWGPSSMSRVRNGDALVGGVKITGNLSLSGERFGDCFDERV